MKRAGGGRSLGFTIVEVMIVLAVSGALFISAMIFISGRQQSAEFTTSVRDFESSLNDLANDVSDGYYANTSGTGLISNCSATASSITITAGTTDNQGGKRDCIFIGKAIQFAPYNSNAQQYNLYTLVGRHYKNANMSSGDVMSFTESGVKAIAKSSVGDTTPSAITSNQVLNGVSIGCAFYIDPVGSPPTTPPVTGPCGMTSTNVVKVDTIAFMTKLHGLDINNNVETGSASVDVLVPKNTTALNRDTYTAVSTINGFSSATNYVKSPAGGFYICLNSGGTRQHALVKMGGGTSGFSASAVIRQGGC